MSAHEYEAEVGRIMSVALVRRVKRRQFLCMDSLKYQVCASCTSVVGYAYEGGNYRLSLHMRLGVVLCCFCQSCHGHEPRSLRR